MIQSAYGKVDLNKRRITALWAFSEAAFGGILHALQIPFSGLFIGSAAVVFISLIAITSKDKSEILKSTIIVILVKAVVSPYSPLTAYFAVFLQGSLGYLFFNFIKNEKAAALLLGFTTMLFSSLQKLIILTLLFGNTIWQSIDLFVEFIINQVGIHSGFPNLTFSYLIISVYISIHLIAGLFFGGQVTKIPDWLRKEYGFIDSEFILAVYTEDYFSKQPGKKKKSWWLRPSGIVILVFSITIMAMSYYSPQLNDSIVWEIVFMLIRSILITVIWFTIISPFLVKRFVKIVEKKKFKYASEINQITALFPNFMKIINYCWKDSARFTNNGRIKKFFANSLALLLTVEIKDGGYRNIKRSD